MIHYYDVEYCEKLCFGDSYGEWKCTCKPSFKNEEKVSVRYGVYGERHNTEIEVSSISDNEIEEILINNGFISASLGNTVLRAETAPVVALSMINYENMRWLLWKK